MTKSSRLPGFYDLSVGERAARVAQWAGLDENERAVLARTGLAAERADQMIENVVGTHSLPLGIAPNFLVNGREYLVPMSIEEPSEELEPFNLRLIELNRRRRFAPHQFPLERKDLRTAFELYRQARDEAADDAVLLLAEELKELVSDFACGLHLDSSSDSVNGRHHA